ncbi:MAG TPA: aminotransferase class I/II-fold pyridoxal phosphate-dependent enzyme [Nocardioidaceae bacterium]|nr:aminotransferase class I/II-fold pyridoxal phosphate-dependent enzyme [Nocardioidaceae bacterium]
MIQESATLAIDNRIRARQAAGAPVLHLGFGEAGLPVHPAVAEVLASNAGRNSYGPVPGALDGRRAAAGYLERRGLPTDPDQIVLAPGSKVLLFALIATLPGDVVLPCPSWVSYAAQAALVDRRVLSVPIPESAGGVPDPALLDEAVGRARADGLDPGILVLTMPDNPTGTVPPSDLVEAVCEVAERHGLVIVSDEIYRDLAWPGHDVVSPAGLAPDRTAVTTGLSKAMALGGYRIGFARLPDGALGRRLRPDVVGVASEIWSSLAGPMQAVAEYVLDEPETVVDHVHASRRLHQTVATAVHREFVAIGADCRPPSGAFYFYPDLSSLRPRLAERGISTGFELTESLLDDFGVGVLAGEAFGDDPKALRFRVATSLLYGRTDEERWQALRSADPLALPWIADALSRLRTALAEFAA